MSNKDTKTETPMDKEQIILKEKRAFELALKNLTNDKKTILAEIERAEQELKLIDTKIQKSEQLIEQLDDVTQKASYFSDAEQLKSIQVKDATNLAATFKVLGREAQQKKKELWSQITTWHNTQSKKKATIGQVINDHQQTIKAIDQEINAKKKDFEQYIMDSAGDNAGKKRAKNVLDAAKDKKILNSFNAPVSILVKTPSKKTEVLPFIFSFKKEGHTWKHIKTTAPVFNKKIIQSVSMNLSINELTINKDFKLDWSIQFTSFEETISKSKNDSITKGKDSTKSKEQTNTNTDKSETTVEGEGEFDILVVEVKTKAGHTWGSENSDSKTTGKSETTKKEETKTKGTTLTSSGKAKTTSCEGTIHYSTTYLEDGAIDIKASGDHKKQQTINDEKYTIEINDHKFRSQFN